MGLIEPAQKHEALLADIADAKQSLARRDDAFACWWLGQSGFLIQWQGRHLLFDPYLSDSLTRKYASTDKPHVRMTERCVDPAKLGFVDVVTSSHNHTDHLDGETLLPLMDASQDLAIVVPEANLEFAASRLGCSADRLLGLNAGQRLDVAGFALHGVPAAHDEIKTNDRGEHHFMGYVATFGSFAVYHSGDTRLFDGMVETLQPFNIDLALLPINGYRPERRVAGNLEADEAAKLAKDIGAKLVVPCHYDMFEFNTVSPDGFVAACEAIEQPYRVLRCGERLAFPATGA